MMHPCQDVIFASHLLCSLLKLLFVCSCQTVPGVHRARQWRGWHPTEEEWRRGERAAAARRQHTHTQPGHTSGGGLHQGTHTRYRTYYLIQVCIVLIDTLSCSLSVTPSAHWKRSTTTETSTWTSFSRTSGVSVCSVSFTKSSLSHKCFPCCFLTILLIRRWLFNFQVSFCNLERMHYSVFWSQAKGKVVGSGVIAIV